jgi:dolichol-phosphate mannosyltransferase
MINRPRYSFVVPVHDEAETLPELAHQLVALMRALDGEAEVLFVDDGSTDGSFEIMRGLHEGDSRFRVLRLSRNFGHQIAITAGLDHAAGDAVVIMDADLQDPPEVVLEMVERWREGYAVVYAVREVRSGEGRTKRLTAKWFYRVLDRLTDVRIPLDTGDFRLVDRKAVDAVRDMREHRRYLRGMFAWVGFDQTGVKYVRRARHAGSTKFSFRRMVSFAADGVFSFSAVPLRVALNAGFLISVVSFFVGFGLILSKIAGLATVPGWASISIGMAFLGGVQLTVLGIMGEYIARIHEEVKHRPLYVVSDELGVTGAAFEERPTRAMSREPSPLVRR